MARILFIVNEHPSEAFAISVARETAKLLRKAGQEVIWRKFKAKETVLGAVLKGKLRKKITKEKLDNIDKQKSDKIISGFIRETKPDIAYNFHCTPHHSHFWGSRTAGTEADFRIIESAARKIELLQLVEIKAHYQRLPKRILNKINAVAPSRPAELEKYLTQTTSQQLTRDACLNPEEYAKSIAARIEKQIKVGLLDLSGRIRRVSNLKVKKRLNQRRARRR